MKLKDRILVTLLLTMGLLLHYITPAMFLGMKVDFLLIFIIISIILFPRFDNYLLVAILGGLFSAMSSTFPGGQIANIIDKLVSTYLILIMVKLSKKHLDKKLITFLVGLLATMASGTIFLASSKFILGLEGIGMNLVYMVVLPAALINGIVVAFLYPIVKRVQSLTAQNL